MANLPQTSHDSLSTGGVQHYDPPGPVAEAFMLDRSPVRFLLGPMGSGKTVTMLYDCLACALQMPKCNDGHRRYRQVILRDTYPNLWNTTIRSWNEWFPQSMGKWSGSKDRKASHHLKIPHADGNGSLLFFEIEFLALGDDTVENVLKGFEPTAIALDEADQHSAEILDFCNARVALQRFPPKSNSRRIAVPEGTTYFSHVTGALNPPDVDNWIYERFVENVPEGHVLFRQPSGRSAQGENHKRVPRERYEELARLNANNPSHVKANIDGEFAPSKSGQPVYPEFSDADHVAAGPLKPSEGVGLRLGFDQGVTGPAMLVTQWMPGGQLRVLREFCPGRIGPSGFARECRLILENEFSGFSVHRATGDPAGFYGGDKETGDLHFFDTIMQILGFPIHPAATQELEVRLDGVRQLLKYRIDGMRPALILSPTCKILRKGFNSKYHYKVKRGNEISYDPKPHKDEFADPQDALQYLAQDLMGIDAIKRGILGGGSGDTAHARGGAGSFGNIVMSDDYDVFG